MIQQKHGFLVALRPLHGDGKALGRVERWRSSCKKQARCHLLLIELDVRIYFIPLLDWINLKRSSAWQRGVGYCLSWWMRGTLFGMGTLSILVDWQTSVFVGSRGTRWSSCSPQLPLLASTPGPEGSIKIPPSKTRFVRVHSLGWLERHSPARAGAGPGAQRHPVPGELHSFPRNPRHASGPEPEGENGEVQVSPARAWDHHHHPAIPGPGYRGCLRHAFHPGVGPHAGGRRALKPVCPSELICVRVMLSGR